MKNYLLIAILILASGVAGASLSEKSNDFFLDEIAMNSLTNRLGRYHLLGPNQPVFADILAVDIVDIVAVDGTTTRIAASMDFTLQAYDDDTQELIGAAYNMKSCSVVFSLDSSLPFPTRVKELSVVSCEISQYDDLKTYWGN